MNLDNLIRKEVLLILKNGWLLDGKLLKRSGFQGAYAMSKDFIIARFSEDDVVIAVEKEEI